MLFLILTDRAVGVNTSESDHSGAAGRDTKRAELTIQQLKLTRKSIAGFSLSAVRPVQKQPDKRKPGDPSKETRDGFCEGEKRRCSLDCVRYPRDRTQQYESQSCS